MATTLAFKPLLDLPEWRSLANAPNASAAGVSVAWDEQLTDPCPYVFQLVSNTVLNAYNTYNDEWMPIISPALAGTFGAGAGAVFCPHYGPAGTLGASAGTTDVVISTVLGTAIVANQWTPYDRSSNEGFFGVLTATASAAGTLTGQAALGDAVVAANEYRNFVIRIVEDTAIPTAVGQRRNITSHLGGASPVYTLATNWTVTPSANARYVIENDRDKILLWTSANINTFTYSISSNAWSTATFAARPAVVAAGVSGVHGYAIEPDARRLARQSFIYSPRGTTNVIDLLDIAGAAAGAWTADIPYGNRGLTAFALGTSMANDPISNNGTYAYVNVAGTQRFARFDFATRHLEPFGWLRYTQGAAVAGQKVAYVAFQDGATRLGLLLALRNTGAELFQLAINR